MQWNVFVHPKAEREIRELSLEMKAKLSRILELMQIGGPFEIREPHVKSLGNKLWEIRLSGRDGISRVIYVLAEQKRIGLLHAFIKKTQKTPKSAIDCALRRLEEM